MKEKPQPLDLEMLIIDLTNSLFHFYGLVDKGYKQALEGIIRKHIKSACEFYLRYKDNPRLFLAKESDSKYVFNYIRKIENILNHKNPSYIAWKLASFDYNEWLFKLAFKDVFEAES